MIIIIASLVAYIILINYISSFIQIKNQEITNPNESTIIDDSYVPINVGDSISFSVKRPRWFGVIYESGEISYIHVFELFYIPKKINGFNFMWIHLIFFILFLLALVKILTKNEKEVT
jgi:hypothetical protein